MTHQPQPQAEGFARALTKLERLRRFNGAPAAFWNGLIEAMSVLAGARMGVLLRKTAAENTGWRRMVVWPEAQRPDRGIEGFVRAIDALAETALKEPERYAVRDLEAGPGSLASDCAIAVHFEMDNAAEALVAVFYFPECSSGDSRTASTLLRLIQDTPGLYQFQRAAHQSQVALSHFTSVLDLMALLNGQHRYVAVAMTLCNELAARHKCDCVSLGWREGDYVRLQAMSHTEKFERKMEAVKALEQTMEESLDQEEFICWPAPENDTRVTRDHGRYAESRGIQQLCSVPLRLNGKTVGIITCERNSEAFSEEEQRLLTLCAEMAVRRLSELKRSDRWFGARLATQLREALGRVIGIERTWAKATAVLAAIGLAILCFGRMTYRVEAPFILRTENVAILSAPFEGYIDEVPGRIGEPVKAHGVLLRLDVRELLLQEAAAAADLDRYTREAEKARANNSLAEMRIAQAQADQARARLDLVRHRLGAAALTAPFDGVVVEGDLQKRIGAPVKQGDVLFKVARTDQMYVECRVDERDIHEVAGTATGEIAFASQPKLKFPIQVQRIEPVAQTKEKENFYIVRCSFQAAAEDWWRPGMSGVAKVNVGTRSFLWILSHRTLDFLRLFFWV